MGRRRAARLLVEAAADSVRERRLAARGRGGVVMQPPLAVLRAAPHAAVRAPGLRPRRRVDGELPVDGEVLAIALKRKGAASRALLE